MAARQEYSHCSKLPAGTGSGDCDTSDSFECHTTPVDDKILDHLKHRGSILFASLSTVFCNLPLLGQADRLAHRGPQHLIQGEPGVHPLKHIGINMELRA